MEKKQLHIQEKMGRKNKKKKQNRSTDICNQQFLNVAKSAKEEDVDAKFNDEEEHK